MGKRGPPPKPSALKKRDGTYRKDRAATNEMTTPASVPDRPSFTDAGARAEWDRVVPQLMELGVLSKIDRSALEGYCRNVASARRYQKLAEQKPMIDTPFGPKVNPAQAEARKSWALARQFAADFGLNPSARSRVGVPEKPPEDKAASFLFGAPPPLQVVNGGRVDPIVRAPAGPVPAPHLPAPTRAADPDEPEDGNDD